MRLYLPAVLAIFLLTPTAQATDPPPLKPKPRVPAPKPKAQGSKPPKISECCFSRDRKAIQKAVMKQSEGVKRCYESALKWAGPGAGGKVEVTWTIAPSGKVQKARIKSSTMGLPTVEACIREAIEAIEFEASDEACPVTFPFVFKPAE